MAINPEYLNYLKTRNVAELNHLLGVMNSNLINPQMTAERAVELAKARQEIKAAIREELSTRGLTAQ